MTTETSVEERVSVTVPARAAAVAWLNAYLAASQDEERPVLYRTLAVELFRDGIHLIGCNGHLLFRTWVGAADREAACPWPDIAEAPPQSVVVMDPEGFGVGFMRTLLRVTNDEEMSREQLTLSTAAGDDGATLALGEEFMSERVILRACGQRLDLKLYESTYPDWRRLNLGIDESERVKGLTVAPKYLGFIGRLKDVHAADLTFHGTDRRIDLVVRGEGSEVRGLLMPMRRADAVPPKPREKKVSDKKSEAT